MKKLICLAAIAVFVLGFMIYRNETQGVIMYEEDSAYLMELYAEEIAFVEQYSETEIIELHAGDLEVILDVHSELCTLGRPEQEALQHLITDLSNAMAHYQAKMIPLSVERGA